MNSDQGNNPKDGAGDLPRFLESKPLKAKQATPAQKKQWVILGVLILFLVFLTLQTLAGGKKKLPQLVKKTAVPIATVVKTAAVTPENDIFKTPGLDQKGRSSPFTRVPSKARVTVQGPAQWVLQGILSDSSGSAYAVINEKIVKKGERMADKVVTTIQSDSVTLRSDSGAEETLRMKK